MLFKIFSALMDIEEEVNNGGLAAKQQTSRKKLTQKEKDKHEYELWVRSEEFEDDE